MYLKKKGVDIDNAAFRLKFTPPMNFSSYRDLSLDNERAQLYAQLAQVPYLSNQFKLKKYLGLSDSEIKENEAKWRQENDYKKFDDASKQLDLRNIGIRAEPNAVVDPEADADLSGLEDPMAGQEDINSTAPGGEVTPPVGPEGQM